MGDVWKNLEGTPQNGNELGCAISTIPILIHLLLDNEVLVGLNEDFVQNLTPILANVYVYSLAKSTNNVPDEK